MIEEKIKDHYFQLLRDFYHNQTEEPLARSAELGRQLVLSKIPPEDIGEIHEQALQRLGAELPDVSLVETARKISIPMVEMLMAYGLSFRDQIEKHEQLKVQLRHSVSEWHKTFDAIRDAIFISDDNQRILRCNRAFTIMTDKPFEEILDRPCWEIVHNTTEPLKNCPFQRMKGSHHHESLTLQQDDKWLFITVEPIESNSHSKMVAVETIQNITEKVETDFKLKKSEIQFRSIYQNSPVGIEIYDREGKLIHANPASLKIFGVASIDDVIGFDLFTDPNVPDSIKKKLKKGENARYENVFDFEIVKEKKLYKTEKSGKIFLDIHIAPFQRDADESGYLVHLLDITDKKLYEKELKASEQKYRDLIENSNDAIYLIHNNKVEIINRRFESLFGITISEMNKPGFDYLQFIAPDHRDYIKDLIKKILTNEPFLPHHQIKALSRDGKELEVEVTITKIKYKDDYAIQTIIRDITEKKKLEREFLQAQKMEAVGKLAGGVAHDFNNLLTVIAGYSQFALSDLDKNDPLYGDIHEISEAAKKATFLTQQLLAFSRKQILKLIVFDLNEVIGMMEKMLSRLISEDISLVMTFYSEDSIIKADEGQIEQILVNLVVNAKDAMPNGGRLTIETRNETLDREFCVRHPQVKEGDYVLLTVSDTGSGISDEIKDKIFEPFFTTKNVGEGTGLGLSTVYGIVAQLDGHIFVESVLKKGTTFKIYFPRVKESVTKEPKKESVPVSLHGSGTVLVVEDDDLVRQFACRSLRKSGYTVLEARNAGEALLTCEELNEPLDLLITDVVMPQMDGKKLAERLEEQMPGMKILFMSGYTDDSIIRYGIQHEQMNFIHKPFSSEDLLRKVKDVMNAPVD